MKFKHVSDGRKESPKSLDEAMGRSVEITNKLSQKDFEESLIRMPLHEMQAKAIDMGVRPLPDRNRLRKVLVERYRKISKTYGGALEKPNNKAGNFLNQFK